MLKRNLGKKGAIMLYLYLFGFIAALVLLVYYAFMNSTVVDFTGVTSLQILNTFEFKERTNYFIDMSLELSVKEAVKNVLSNGGYSSVLLASNKERYPCGYTGYPVLNDGKNTDKCFPDLSVEIENEFSSSFEGYLSQYPNLLLRVGDFIIKPKRNGAHLDVEVFGAAPIKVPFFTDSSSNYVDVTSVYLSSTYFSSLDLELVPITNIDRVVCVESTSPTPGVTDYGRICLASKVLSEKLIEISNNELKPKGWKIVITQAYRDYGIQKSLYLALGSKACNPDGGGTCPHMTGGAIDVVFYDSNNNAINFEGSPRNSEIEKLMCSYGFVRYSKEYWHFEYGTNRWKQAVEARNRGETACKY